MKIFQLVDSPYVGNPYVPTLMDGITKIDSTSRWGYGLDSFWSDDIYKYDIVHIHWPHMIVNFFSDNNIISQYENKLRHLKELGIKIVATCHNFEPHYEKDTRKKDSYAITYGYADCIIHLGEYSLNLLKGKYPLAKHFLIPHHVYNQIYKPANKAESIENLGLNHSKKYVLCFGDFRDDEERRLVDCVLKHYLNQGIEILAPHYYRYVKRKNKLKMLYAWIMAKYKQSTTKGMHIYGKYISDDMLPFYYGASEICLIQRKKILNSGNLPMAFYMGKVVVGPRVGNVGQILEQTGNPTFEPDDINSLYQAIDKAMTLCQENKGVVNKKYAENNWTTEIVSYKLYSVYKEMA